jgi:putative hydroxymethylpyrimidine transport system substrate-binding protein
MVLDWVPNPDHVGLYYAQKKGALDKAGLSVQLNAPSDASAPLKLVGTGKFDVAISYEPELFFAAEKKLPVVAVASVVPVPLNSVISLKKAGITSAAKLKGKSVGEAGLPFDTAVLTTLRRVGRLSSEDVKSVNVGFNLVPALLSGKVDAIIGGYRNVEAVQLGQETGQKPNVLPLDRVGVPTYDELVLVANSNRLKSDPQYAANVKKLIAAMIQGTKQAKANQAEAVSIMKDVSDYKAKLIEASVPATLALMTPKGAPIGCMIRSQWQNFGTWMKRTKLLKKSIGANAVMTTKYLPTRC